MRIISCPIFRTYGLLAGGMVLSGSAAPVSKMVSTEFPPMLASGLRMTAAAALLTPILLVPRRRQPAVTPPIRVMRRLGRHAWLLLTGMTVIGTFGFTLALYYGMQFSSGAVAAAVTATTPGVTAVIAVLWLGGRINVWAAGGLGIVVAGATMMGLQDGPRSTNALLGGALVFASVCAAAVYTVLGQQLTTVLTPLIVATTTAIYAGVLFAPLAIIEAIRFDWSAPGILDWLSLLWWGAIAMGFGSVLWLTGAARAEGATVYSFMALLPISAVAASCLVLGEVLRWQHLAGIAAAVIGIAIVARGQGRPRVSPSELGPLGGTGAVEQIAVEAIAAEPITTEREVSRIPVTIAEEVAQSLVIGIGILTEAAEREAIPSASWNASSSGGGEGSQPVTRGYLLSSPTS